MQIIKKTAESRIFKVILMLVAFMFMSVSFNSIFQNQNDELIKVEDSILKFEDFFLTKALKNSNDLSSNDGISENYKILINSMRNFSLNNLFNKYQINVSTQDMDKYFPSLNIEKITNEKVVQYLKQDFKNSVLMQIVSYNPVKNLQKELERLSSASLIVNEYTLPINKISINEEEIQNVTQQDLQDFYNANIDLFTIKERYIIEYIKVAQNEIDEIDEEVAKGTLVKDIIKKYNLQAIKKEKNAKYFAKFNINSEDLQENYTSYVMHAKKDNFIFHITKILPQEKIKFDENIVKEVYIAKMRYKAALKIVEQFKKERKIEILNSNSIKTISRTIASDDDNFFNLIKQTKNVKFSKPKLNQGAKIKDINKKDLILHKYNTAYIVFYEVKKVKLIPSNTNNALENMQNNKEAVLDQDIKSNDHQTNNKKSKMPINNSANNNTNNNSSSKEDLVDDNKQNKSRPSLDLFNMLNNLTFSNLFNQYYKNAYFYDNNIKVLLSPK